MVYLVPFLSFLAGSKSISVHPSDLDTMTITAVEAIAWMIIGLPWNRTWLARLEVRRLDHYTKWHPKWTMMMESYNMANRVQFPGHLMVNQVVIRSRPPFGVTKVKQRRWGDEHHSQMLGLLKSDGRTNLPLPYDLCGLWDYLLNLFYICYGSIDSGLSYHRCSVYYYFCYLHQNVLL